MLKMCTDHYGNTENSVLYCFLKREMKKAIYLFYLIKIFGLSAQFIIIFIRIKFWSNIIPKLIIQVSIHAAKI